MKFVCSRGEMHKLLCIYILHGFMLLWNARKGQGSCNITSSTMLLPKRMFAIVSLYF